MILKRRNLFIAVAVAISFIVVWGLATHEPEPVYQGKPLTVWLAGYGGAQDDSLQWRQADEAVGHVGTAAIPTLLRMISARETLYTRFIRWAHRKSLFGITNDPVSAWNLNYQAEHAFEKLGPVASNAVPALIEIYESRISISSQWEAVGALGAIGPASSNAVPLLVEATISTNLQLRLGAVAALGQIHAQPELSIPALMKALRHPDASTRETAVIALGAFKGDAKVAVPALKELIQGPPTPMVAWAAEALNEIEPGAANSAVPALQQMATNDNRYIRDLADRVLKKVDVKKQQ